LPGLIAGQVCGKHIFPSKATAHLLMGGCTSFIFMGVPAKA
jgi:hypothetical protein